MIRLRWIAAFGAFLVAISVPFWLDDSFVIQLLFRVAIFAVLGIAWNLIGGYAGQLSLGHVTYFGLGAYGFSLLHLNAGLGMWTSLLLGSLVACSAALVIGIVTFRLRGPYFVLSTIAAAEIVRIIALNARVTHGAIGLLPPSLFSNPRVDAKFYVTAVLLVTLALAFAEWTDGSRFGYYLRAIRENEDTAMAVGIPPARYKLLALLPSALLTAVAGGIYGSFSQFVGPESVLTLDISIQAAVIAMLGGAATVWGPLVGSLVLTISSEAFKAVFEEAHLLIYGLLLVVVVLFLPGGLVSLPSRLKSLVRGHARRATDAPLNAAKRGMMAEPLLHLENVTKRFGGLVAVNKVSFDLVQGETLFLIGPNGAGKTTLFNVITGFLHPDGGNVSFEGTSLNGVPPYEATRRGIGRTFQIVKPLGSLTVVENVMLGAFLHDRVTSRAKEKALDCLEFLGLKDRAHYPASGIPLAARKLLEIARALATRPKLLLLDEVMAGLNPAESVLVVDALKRLPERGVSTIGGVEHIMRVVMALATRVVVLDQGRMLVAGKPAEIARDPRVVEAYLGTKFRETLAESYPHGSREGPP